MQAYKHTHTHTHTHRARLPISTNREKLLDKDSENGPGV